MKDKKELKKEFIIYRVNYSPVLQVALLAKKTAKGYLLDSPRDALGIIGAGCQDHSVANDKVVAVVDKDAAVRIYSIMLLLLKQHRKVIQASKQALNENIEIIARSLQIKETEDDEDSENGG